ncbi:MAG: hemolysin family protein [Anaerolineae bacterium]
MDPDGLGEIVLLVFLIILNAFFAAAEIAVVSVRKARLRQLIEEGNETARTLERLAEDSSRFLATIQIGETLAVLFAAATAAVFFTPRLQTLIAQTPSLTPIAKLSYPLALILIVLALSLVMLILGELVPKTLARQYAEPIALFVAGPLDLFATISLPFVRVLVAIANFISSLFGSSQPGDMPFIIEEEIKTMIDAGEEKGIIEEDEKEMLYSVFEIGETVAREIMVPRIDVVAIEVGTPLLEALDIILEAGHSRIPVYEETIDNIVGLLYAKDLLAYLRDGERTIALRDILRPAYFIPEARKVDDLLGDLQQRKVHMAIVVDEYGGMAGLVTIEDILEEIVGEIQDEYDTEEPFIEVVNANEVIFNARVDLDDVNKLLEVELPAEGSDTLGGLIYSQLGRVPSVGDEVIVDGLRISVLSVAGRRIKKVRVSKEGGKEGIEEEAGGS